MNTTKTAETYRIPEPPAGTFTPAESALRAARGAAGRRIFGAGNYTVGCYVPDSALPLIRRAKVDRRAVAAFVAAHRTAR